MELGTAVRLYVVQTETGKDCEIWAATPMAAAIHVLALPENAGKGVWAKVDRQYPAPSRPTYYRIQRQERKVRMRVSTLAEWLDARDAYKALAKERA